ncbi:hypothetical protein RCH18_002681, partial [Flavobacterium sp. PL11]|nr:hypothetical protein [Flavobacterium sp. PL11]
NDRMEISYYNFIRSLRVFLAIEILNRKEMM